VSLIFINPFKPGAGHDPPYLAGRRDERDEFGRLLRQEVVLENLVLTGLRGVGKTVLLESFRPQAREEGWLWAGTDLSESASLTEEVIALRLLTDIATVTSAVVVQRHEQQAIGFDGKRTTEERTLDFSVLRWIYDQTPGLVSDKLRAVLEKTWKVLTQANPKFRGLVFAYDEAQNLSDHAKKQSYPLSLLLEVFQSIQRKGVRFLLVLAGLPTLYPKLVEARTYAERMFRVVFLSRLSDADSREAITKPIAAANCPVQLAPKSVDSIVAHSCGYPYFIQFIGREVYEAFLGKAAGDSERWTVPIDAITRKLDTDFFSGRWARVTDRQRDLLFVIAGLATGPEEEFTVQAIVEAAKQKLAKGFSSSLVSQMLVKLADAGLVYKNRHGRYAFAVPLFAAFILRERTT
jgi:AAA ATPase domain